VKSICFLVTDGKDAEFFMIQEARHYGILSYKQWMIY